jgi:hypothetical protein
MVKNVKKSANILILISLLASTLIASTLTLKPAAAANHPGPYFTVDPASISKGPDPAVGDTFIVTINLNNVTVDQVPDGLSGLEIRFHWNNTLIRPTGFTNLLGTSGGVFFPLGGGMLLYGVGPGFFDESGSFIATPPYTNATYYKVAVASTGTPWYGDGTVVNIVFEVVYQPTWWYQKAMGELEFEFTDLVDANVETVSHEVEESHYEIVGPVPSTVPHIAVVPGVVTEGPEAAIGNTFTTAVKLYDVDPDYLPAPDGIYGVEIRLEWNSTLIQPVSYQHFIGDATDGVLNAPAFLVLDNLTTSSYHLVATSLPPAAAWSGTDKTIVEITFEVMMQKLEPNDLSGSFDLTITDIAMLPDDAVTAVQVPHTNAGGIYQILGFPTTNEYVVTYNSIDYSVFIDSDSIITAPNNLGFDNVAKTITFNVTTTDGFCNVTVPKNFMWSEPATDWIVEIDDVPTMTAVITEDATNTYLWFDFAAGEHVILLQSEFAVPEFTGPQMILLLLVATAMIVVATAKISKKKFPI